MPSLSSLTSISRRTKCSLFNIRLNDDFIVFRGSEHESSGQLLKGVVVLCIVSPLRIEDMRLRLTGTLRMQCREELSIPTSGVGSLFNRASSTVILDHQWAPFIGRPGESSTLPIGNYEYPFEYTLPGQTAESVEGIPEASITYRLEATVRRGKMSPDLHAYKPLRIIRTLEPSALGFLHTVSLEDIWPNYLEYSIVIPQKAVFFGGVVDLKIRCTPLVKELELGSVTARLFEICECRVGGVNNVTREQRRAREVTKWVFNVSREEHWQDMIGDTCQQGWILNKSLNLPRALSQCIQDIDLFGVQVRHKILLTMILIHPHGQRSEIRGTLPVSIFISPNIPFDEDGKLVSQKPAGNVNAELGGLRAPPCYGKHALDQLYDDSENRRYQTPSLQSNFASSRQLQEEPLKNLLGPAHTTSTISRLTGFSLDPFRSRISFQPPPHATSQAETSHISQNIHHDVENGSTLSSSGLTQIEKIDLAVLSRVPSYDTAVARSCAQTAVLTPDYQTALSAPRTPPAVVDMGPECLLSTIENSSSRDANACPP